MPWPRQVGARLGDDPAGAAALAAGARDGEEALLVSQLPGAAALRARRRRGAGCGARAAAGLTGLLTRDLDGRFGALRGLLERNLHVVAQVGAALRPAAPAAAAEHVAEAEDVAEAAEDVLEVREDGRVDAAAPAGRAGHAGMAEAVVARALVGVGQHRVGFGRFLEALLRGLVARDCDPGGT